MTTDTIMEISVDTINLSISRFVIIDFERMQAKPVDGIRTQNIVPEQIGKQCCNDVVNVSLPITRSKINNPGNSFFNF